MSENIEIEYCEQIKLLRVERSSLEKIVHGIDQARADLNQTIQDAYTAEAHCLDAYASRPTADNKSALEKARLFVLTQEQALTDFEQSNQHHASDLKKITKNEKTALNKLISYRKVEAIDSLQAKCKQFEKKLMKDFPEYLALKCELNGYILGLVEMDRFVHNCLPDTRMLAGQSLDKIREDLMRIE